jgi:hypothetical protein
VDLEDQVDRLLDRVHQAHQAHQAHLALHQKGQLGQAALRCCCHSYQVARADQLGQAGRLHHRYRLSRALHPYH